MPRAQKADVLYDYAAAEANQCSLKAGQMIDVLQHEFSPGWSKGTVDGKNGMFPSNYYKLRPPPRPTFVGVEDEPKADNKAPQGHAVSEEDEKELQELRAQKILMEGKLKELMGVIRMWTEREANDSFADGSQVLQRQLKESQEQIRVMSEEMNKFAAEWAKTQKKNRRKIDLLESRNKELQIEVDHLKKTVDIWQRHEEDTSLYHENAELMRQKQLLDLEQELTTERLKNKQMEERVEQLQSAEPSSGGDGLAVNEDEVMSLRATNGALKSRVEYLEKALAAWQQREANSATVAF